MADNRSNNDAGTGTWCRTISDMWAEICPNVPEAELAAMPSEPYNEVLQLSQPTDHPEQFVGQMDVGPGAGVEINWVGASCCCHSWHCLTYTDHQYGRQAGYTAGGHMQASIYMEEAWAATAAGYTSTAVAGPSSARPNTGSRLALTQTALCTPSCSWTN